MYDRGTDCVIGSEMLEDGLKLLDSVNEGVRVGNIEGVYCMVGVATIDCDGVVLRLGTTETVRLRPTDSDGEVLRLLTIEPVEDGTVVTELLGDTEASVGVRLFDDEGVSREMDGLWEADSVGVCEADWDGSDPDGLWDADHEGLRSESEGENVKDGDVDWLAEGLWEGVAEDDCDGVAVKGRDGEVVFDGNAPTMVQSSVSSKTSSSSATSTARRENIPIFLFLRPT